MSTIFTTLYLLIGLGLAIETTNLTTDVLPSGDTCIEPPGTLPPPPPPTF